jgi:hypothetical protein
MVRAGSASGDAVPSSFAAASFDSVKAIYFGKGGLCFTQTESPVVADFVEKILGPCAKRRAAQVVGECLFLTRNKMPP